jgi:hypothetical protein
VTPELNAVLEDGRAIVQQVEWLTEHAADVERAGELEELATCFAGVRQHLSWVTAGASSVLDGAPAP